ncbi:hypothetical protein D3C72_813730 [compost metagenome]
MDMITISAESAIEMLVSICIRLDDEDYEPTKEEQKAFGELYSCLNDEQKEAVVTKLGETYSGDKDAYGWFVAYLNSGMRAVSKCQCGKIFAMSEGIKGKHDVVLCSEECKKRWNRE